MSRPFPCRNNPVWELLPPCWPRARGKQALGNSEGKRLHRPLQIDRQIMILKVGLDYEGNRLHIKIYFDIAFAIKRHIIVKDLG